MNELDFNKFKEFFVEVCNQINSAKIEAYKPVNSEPTSPK